MAIDITTISVEMDTSSLKAGQVALNDTAKAGDKLATSATGAGKAAKAGFDDVAMAALKSEQATAKASVGMSKMRIYAQDAGRQLQDVAVQAQMGASAFTIIGQQGSQFASVFGPAGAVVGAVIAVGSAVGGVLFKSFMTTSKAMEEMTENTKKLVKEYKDFSDAQQKIINQGLSYTIADQSKKYDEQTKAIDKTLEKIKQLNDEHGKSKTVQAVSSFGATTSYTTTVDNTKAIAEEEKKLTSVKVQQLGVLKEIEAINDPSGAMGKIENIQKEAELVGLVGKAYWEVKAAHEGIKGAAAQEFIANNLLLESKLKTEKEKQDAIKKTQSESEKAAKKASAEADNIAKAEESRAKQINGMVTSMTREADLMGEQSKEAQIIYDIEKGILSVKDGINGAEAQRLIAASKVIDSKNKEIELNEKLADMAERDYMKTRKTKEDAEEESRRLSESISSTLTDALMRGFESGKGFAQNLKDTVKNMFKTLIIQPVIKPLMDKAAGAMSSIIGSSGTKGADGKTTGGAGMLGMLGPYGAMIGAAAAIGGALISKFNSSQEAKFEKMTAEYRQGIQGTGTLLGMANAKSDSINKALSEMGDNGASLLDVNYGMYQALLDIKTGIAGSAAGFARQSLGGKAEAGIKTGTSTFSTSAGFGAAMGKTNIGVLEEIGGFLDSLVNGLAKGIYKKQISVIDSGIEILGASLSEIMEKGSIGAFNYAEVQTKKKTLGLTTSNKVKTETSDLDDEFKIQFAKVFDGAGQALEEASKEFGATFDASKLMIDTTKLSLKGLEGDALTKEIESFFSATLDKWADSLVEGLTQFQQVGEGAFETMIRLASQTNIFTNYAGKLLPKFNMVGMAAIEATQSVAELAGGFDRLNSNMSSYYNNFFSETEKTEAGLKNISEALAGVGLTMPKTRDEFRALVESLDLSTESQQKQYAALLDVNQAFAQLVPAAKEAAKETEKVADSFDAVAEQQKSLSDKLFNLTATDSEKRTRLLEEALNEENKGIQKQIFAAEDLIAYREKDLRSQEDAAAKKIQLEEEVQAKIDAIATERYGLESSLLQLNGDTNALREREISALDETNRPLQRQIWALEDLAASAEKSARETQAAKDIIDANMRAANDQLIDMERKYFDLTATEQEKRSANMTALLTDEAREIQSKIYAYNDAKDAAQAQEQAAKDAAQAQEQALNDARQAAEEQRKLAQGVHDSISSALKSLMGESETLNAMTQSQARLTLQNALMTAKSGGSLVGFAGLEDALGAVQKGGTYGSALESRLAQGRNIGLLSELAKYTKIDGSHANGLESVPYDGYIAQLHKGERVQTANEAQSNSALAAKLDRLIEVVNSGNIAIAKNTAAGAKVLEKWDDDGIAETRSVA